MLSTTKMLLTFVATLSVAFFVMPQGSQCQSSFFFDYYNSGNGLSQNSVYSIAQTSDGFMWFGTQEGINRFDGKYFTQISENYNRKDKNEMDYGEFSKTINCLLCDSRDHLWVGTAKEIAIYDQRKNKFYTPSFYYPGLTLPPDPNIVAVSEIQQVLWILTQNKGVYAYDTKRKAMINLRWQGQAPKKILSVQRDSQNRIWLCSEKEIFLLNGDLFHPVEQINNFLKPAGLIDMRIVGAELWLINGKRQIYYCATDLSPRSIKHFPEGFTGLSLVSDPALLHLSNDSMLWIGSRSDGLLKVNLRSRRYEPLADNSPKQILNTRFVLSCFTDRQKITWVGLSGGIFKFDHKDTRIDLWRAGSTEPKKTTDNHIMSIFSANDRDMYMGTLNGGLLHLDLATGEHQHYMPTNIGNALSESKNIYEVIGEGQNMLWMATWGGLYSFNTLTKQFIEYKDFNDEQTLQLCALLKLHHTDFILIGGYNGGLRLFNTLTKHFSKPKDDRHFLDNTRLRVRYMKEFEHGDILMSTETQCLVKYNYISGLFTTYPQFSRICGASRYFCFHDKYLWIATDDGLIQADRQTMAVLRCWTSKNGLANDYIYAIQPDRYGRIWISSNGGLSMIDAKNNTCRNFSLSDNLQDLEFNTASCYTDQKGNLWFGGINGMNMVEPNITPPDTFSPRPTLTQINVMNQPFESDTAIPYLHKIVLPYNKNFISLQFQTLNFSQTDKIVYKYYLEDVDTGWIHTSQTNLLNYTQLQPGQYTFHMMSANAGDIWCKNETTLQIIITPPWWQSWWFRILAISSFCAAIFYLISARIRSIRKQENLKYKIIETEMKSLRSQMNPHFIFNSLNSINGFIIENKTHLASDYLTKFSRLIRLILENSKNETITLEKEIETLKLYLLMESLRFEDKFTYSVNVQADIDLDDINIPPLIIQPYVENAIWHGLLPKPQKGWVKIDITQNAERLRISINDNGIGREQAQKNNAGRTKSNRSYGMEITQQRILTLHPKNSIVIDDLKDRDDQPSGTRVTLHIYLPPNS